MIISLLSQFIATEWTKYVTVLLCRTGQNTNRKWSRKMLHVQNRGFILLFRLDFKSNIISISSDLFYLMVWLGVFLDFQPGHIRLILRQTVGCYSKIKSQNTIKRNKIAAINLFCVSSAKINIPL